MSTPRHLLLVDDDADLLQLLSLRLTANGYRVTAVASAEAAQAQLGSVLSATDSDAVALKPLAQLLVSNYAEMRRLSDNAEKAGQQARDNQRRLDQLSEKLEALKNIERTLPGQPK